MTIKEITLSVSDKISLEAYLGPKYKFCTVEPWFSIRAELDPSDDVHHEFARLREYLNVQTCEYRKDVIQSRKDNG